jgi:hypothetical protein
MSDKLNWMKEQLEEDGWGELNIEDIKAILDGAVEDFEDTLVDCVLELESEWATDGNI